MTAPTEDYYTSKPSVHNRTLALLSYEGTKLNCISGKQSELVSKHWKTIRGLLENGSFKKLNTFGVLQSYVIFPQNMGLEERKYKVFEKKIEGETQTRALIMSTQENENIFDTWFINHVLEHSRLELGGHPIVNGNYKALSSKIIEIFDEELRNVAEGDEWEKTGRAYFTKVLDFFTSRMLKIETCLPAFPCKSNNTNKVAGTLPDKGEELALRRLTHFAQKVNKVYPPGIKMWVVSDGHVFSDCVGANDSDVDIYGGHLHKMAQSIASKDIVDFMALPDIFSFKLHRFEDSYVEHIELPHFLGTEIGGEAELCRKIMTAACSTDEKKLAEMIDGQDPIKVSLYRGFRTFMEEDLALHPVVKPLSRKFRKALCGKVAFEMIKRNEAYSNLVELMLPFHVRLSIHAHSNSGPKFGIRLFSAKECKVVKCLKKDSATPVFDDLLHIPTPWHNSVIKVKGQDLYCIGKSEVVKNAISHGTYNGEWVEGDLESGVGGHFIMWKSEGPAISKIPVQVGQSLTSAV